VQRRRRHSQIEAALAQVRRFDVAMNDLQAWSIEVSEEMCGKLSARFNGRDTSASANSLRVA
jgi:hypothetical protein